MEVRSKLSLYRNISWFKSSKTCSGAVLNSLLKLQKFAQQSRTLLDNVSLNSSNFLIILQELVKTGIVRADEVKRIGQEEDVGRFRSFLYSKS